MERPALIQALMKCKRDLVDVTGILLGGNFLTADAEDDLILACQDVLFDAVKRIDSSSTADAKNPPQHVQVHSAGCIYYNL